MVGVVVWWDMNTYIRIDTSHTHTRWVKSRSQATQHNTRRLGLGEGEPSDGTGRRQGGEVAAGHGAGGGGAEALFCCFCGGLMCTGRNGGLICVCEYLYIHIESEGWADLHLDLGGLAREEPPVL